MLTIDDQARWDRVRQGMKQEMGKFRYKMWIEPMELRFLKPGVYVAVCQNPFALLYVQEHHSTAMVSRIRDAFGLNVQVLWISRQVTPKAGSFFTRPKQRPLFSMN